MFLPIHEVDPQKNLPLSIVDRRGKKIVEGEKRKELGAVLSTVNLNALHNDTLCNYAPDS